MAKRRKNGRFVSRSRAVTRYVARGRRYFRRSRKISLLRTAGWIYPVTGIYLMTRQYHSTQNLANNPAGWTYAVYLAALRQFLGLSTAFGIWTWQPKVALTDTWGPILVGEAAHRLANRFGLNRQPFVKRLPIVNL